MKGLVIMLVIAIFHCSNISSCNYLVQSLSLREDNISIDTKIIKRNIINLKISPRLYN